MQTVEFPFCAPPIQVFCHLIFNLVNSRSMTLSPNLDFLHYTVQNTGITPNQWAALQSSFVRTNTNRLSAQNIPSSQLHNFMHKYSEFVVLHFPVRQKVWLQSPMLNLTVLKFKSLPEQNIALAPTPGVRNVNHAFSQPVTVSPSCHKMSLHISMVQLRSCVMGGGR